MSDSEQHFVFAEMPITGTGMFAVVPADNQEEAISRFVGELLNCNRTDISMCDIDNEVLVTYLDKTYRLMSLKEFTSRPFVSKILEDLYRDKTGDNR